MIADLADLFSVGYLSTHFSLYNTSKFTFYRKSMATYSWLYIEQSLTIRNNAR